MRTAAAGNPRTTGRLIVDSLVAHGVDTVFAIPGVQTYELFDALAGEPSIEVIGARHEQAVAYMAFGYAQATGRLGVYSVVPGPGVLNSSAALISAYGASQPVLCLTSEIPTEYLGRGLGHLHELPDQLATLRTITKWAANVEHPLQAGELMAEAIHQATSGRPRPVALATPWDVLGKQAVVADVEPRVAAAGAVDPAAIDAAVDVLRSARHPMIMVGGGAREAAAEVRKIAELLQAPVVSFRGGRGVVSDEDPRGFTCAAGFERWADTDVVLGIGTRLELSWFRWPDTPPDLRMVTVDIDPAQVARLTPTVAVVSDAAVGTRALIDGLRAAGTAAADRSTEFAAVKAAKATEIADVGPELAYLTAIRAALPRDGYLVEEICQVGFASYFGFPVYEPRHFITCGHQGTLGFGYPTALGVKAAHRDKAVVAIAGDGGFMFGVQELATAVQYHLAVIAVVFDNAAFGNVLLDQRRLFGAEHVLGAELRNPDFARLADAFGADGYRADSPDELAECLRKAIAADRPAVIHVRCELGVGTTPWKYLMPASRSGA